MEYFGTSLTEHGHYRWILNGDYAQKCWGKYDDLPFHPENLTNSENMTNGETAFYQSAKYTAIAICGSCTDSRRGSKSVFWIREIITKQEMAERILNNPLAKQIVDKMNFKVNW